MDEHHRQDEYYDTRSTLSNSERECIRDIDDTEDLVERLHDQRQAALEKLWANFQVAASSLAQLYKDGSSCDCCDLCIYRQNNHDRWQPFQGAANKVTILYRDGSEALRAGMELGYNAGYQKRNRDIANWVRKKRKLIRREDLLYNLSGRSPPRRKHDSRTTSLSMSPKPMSPTNDLLTFSDPCDLDFSSLVDGRNPFLSANMDGRKRLNDVSMMESPHKRSKFS